MTASNYFLPSDIQRAAEDLSPRLSEQTFSAMPACRHHLPQTQPFNNSYILIWGRKNILSVRLEHVSVFIQVGQKKAGKK